MWSHPIHEPVLFTVGEAVVDLRQFNAVVQDLVVAAVGEARERLPGLLDVEGWNGKSVAAEGGVRESLAHLMLSTRAQVMQVVLVYDARVWVATHVHDDFRLCLVRVHVVEREEVFGLVERDHLARLAFYDVKSRRLLVVPLHTLVERPSLDLHRQQRPHIHNERILDKHEVVWRHGKAVVVAQTVFRDESRHNVHVLKRVSSSVCVCGRRGPGGNLRDVVPSPFFERHGHVVDVALFVLVWVWCH